MSVVPDPVHERPVHEYDLGPLVPVETVLVAETELFVAVLFASERPPLLRVFQSASVFIHRLPPVFSAGTSKKIRTTF